MHSYEPAPSRLSGFWLAGALPVSLATPHQCARPRGAAAAGRAAAGRCRAGRGRRCAGRCRGAAGQPGHATPARQTSRRCRCSPGRRWRAPSRSRSRACLLALKAGAAALPVGLATPRQRAGPRGAATAGRRRTGRGPALLARLWPVPCRLYPLLWPQRPVRFGCMRTHANDFQPVVAAVAAVASAKASGKASRGVLLLAGPPLAGAEPIEVEDLPVGAAALPVSLATPHQCARPRGAAATGRAAAGRCRAGRGRVPAFWR